MLSPVVPADRLIPIVLDEQRGVVIHEPAPSPIAFGVNDTPGAHAVRRVAIGFDELHASTRLAPAPASSGVAPIAPAAHLVPIALDGQRSPVIIGYGAGIATTYPPPTSSPSSATGYVAS